MNSYELIRYKVRGQAGTLSLLVYLFYSEFSVMIVTQNNPFIYYLDIELLSIIIVNSTAAFINFEKNIDFIGGN